MTEARVARVEITIIGGGLAGCEAAWQAARLGHRAVVREMKPEKYSPAHSIPTLAELVCSNSLKATGLDTSSGLLKEEMRLLDSLVVRAAEATAVPAGSALAVDRRAFSEFITDELARAGVEVRSGEVTELPAGRPLIVATGPLTSDAFAENLLAALGSKRLFFYDAVAPIVYRDSIDMTRAFMASRYGRGGDDYINCPLDHDGYESFVENLLAADTVREKGFERIPCFEGCMPIEELAGRGPMTLAFGPMKPVGLTDPATGARPFAVAQLRRENLAGTLYNMVGFQTRLSYPEQKRVFRMIPGLEGAEFARLGKIHRNTYLDSPGLIERTLALVRDPALFFAGQITGVEGYCESSVTGILAGINAVRVALGLEPSAPPPSTMTGALVEYISTEAPGGSGRAAGFQPMNANFGLLPPLDPASEEALKGARGREKRKARKRLLSERAVADLVQWRKDSLATLL
ncbi:MAG: methylenetetrahydrofolate--tRNA-(uracil(54)-C(5))-methyltransferase (FADH(2)-oxidizing) TrmFO [Thermodesulfobacteriota bacterium]